MNHPTIRTLAGAAAPHAIDAKSTALLVIDFQNEYFDGRLPVPNGLPALRNTQRLIAYADQKRMPVFHVQHLAPAESPVFAETSKSVEFHRELQPAPHHVVLQKTSVSVFPTTDLDSRLKASGIRTLIVTGLMTHACVAGAARDAVPLGYDVIVVDDACATRDIDAPGGVIPHDVLHRSALASIDDTFGAIVTTDQLLKLPAA
ncbi:cysteine hydrolase family protein [Burkholderia guangdongensis]|uniref:cysteine hydrolase family protein n=1 Tax=Burkholderia guangdongensis TaxID=1792500 RepID=UPI0015C7CA30|nr:cysteine hydrolase family protein [Burkholderia guangdongensis]